MKYFLANVAMLVVAMLVVAILGIGHTRADAAPPLSAYGKLPGFSNAVLSPSGRMIAVIGVIGEERRLVVLDNGNRALLAVPLGDAKVRELYWIGENQILIYKSDTVALGMGFTADQAELFSAVVVPIDGRKIWAVFKGNKNITGGVRGFYGVNRRGEKWYGYFGGITLEKGGATEPRLVTTKPVLYEVDLQTGFARKIGDRSGDGVYRSWTLGPDGTVVATLDYVSKSGSWSIRNAQGQKIATGVSKLGGADLVSLGSAGDTLIYSLTDDDDGENHRFEVALGGGEAKEILADADVQHSFIDPRSRRFIGYRVTGEMPAYRFVNGRQQKIVDATLKAFPGYAVTLIDWNDAFDTLIVKTEGGDDPQSWWLVDIKTSRAQPLGQSYLVAPADVGPVKMIRYKAGDGLEIAGVLTLPPGREARNLPVIIFPHGGPSSHDMIGFDWWAQALASRGYAVLQPNFRGSTGYGAAFERAGHGEWGRKMQTDMSDGLAYLAREGIADPRRACIMGASFGGYAALAGVTLQQGVYRCAVSVNGVADVVRLMSTDLARSRNDPAMRRGLEQQIGVRRDLGAVSPLRFADKVTAPVLLIHGKDDTVVLYDQSNDMAAALRRAGKTVEFVTLAGEDHWLSKGSTRLAMLQATVAFIERYNPADASAASAAIAPAPAPALAPASTQPGKAASP
ncbi:S9 family peptidase [Sphingobium sp. AN641]|uniref:alpha/beta hydrolase family protein n=1 Tax=Sphingobium sp. AN641 TaxID=3133443 RepID=UPI0030C28D98